LSVSSQLDPGQGKIFKTKKKKGIEMQEKLSLANYRTFRSFVGLLDLELEGGGSITGSGWDFDGISMNEDFKRWKKMEKRDVEG
jgi:hypothetical protein